MGKISIYDLADVLVERKKLDKRDAVAFVTAMFEIVRKHLEEEKLVKIKGFGTFKIIDVDDRESVNVNTGERVLIEGHGKITFIPDALMKELVNKPFSQFETVVLNEGVDFADPEPLVEPEPEPEAEYGAAAMPLVDFGESNVIKEEPLFAEPEPEPEPELEEAVVEEPVVEDVVEEAVPVEEETIPEPEIEPEIEEPVVEEPVVKDVVEEAVPVEEETIPEPEPEPKPEIEEPVVEEAVVEEAAPVEEEPMPEPEEEPEPEPEEEALVEEESAPRKSKVWIWSLLLGLVLGVVIGVLIDRFMITQQPTDSESVKPVVEKAEKAAQPKAEKPETDATETPEQSAEAAQVKSEEKAPAESAEAEAAKAAGTAKPETKPVEPAKKAEAAKAAGTAKPEAKPVEPAKKAEAAKTEAKTAQTVDPYAAKDVRVRLGAWRIVGTDQVVKVREGQTLKRLSKFYLGPDMECYVEVYNNLSPNAELKVGQEIKIPKLVHKKSLKKQ